MKLRIEIALTDDAGPNYSTSRRTPQCVVVTRLLSVPVKQFKVKSLDVLSEARAELIEAFDRVIDAERVAAEKSDREKAEKEASF